MKKMNGMTLIELMIVVAIVSIIAAVGYPSYQEHVRTSRIGEATAGVSELKMKMQQYYMNNRRYSGFNGGEENCSNMTQMSSDFFDFVCEVEAQTFTIQARGKGAMSGFVYSIDEEGKMTSVVSDVADHQSCWIKKAGGSC